MFGIIVENGGDYMIKDILWWSLLIMTLMYLVYMVYDIYMHRDQLEKETSFLKTGIFAFFTLFFDVLGIGAFAPHTTLYRFFKQVDDRIIPGTLNAGNAIPTVLQALIFIKLIKVDTLTLVLMIFSSVIGSYIGAKFVSRMNKKKIQLSMGFALLITAVFLLLSALGLMDLHANGYTLRGILLVIGVSVNFLLGALMTIGVGLYSPCMALVAMLGMSPTAAFPIMMGSCAFLMPVCGVTFIKENAYNRKAAMAATLFGTVGVILAAYFVKSLPLGVLRWIVVAVVVYTAISMIKEGMKKVTV